MEDWEAEADSNNFPIRDRVHPTEEFRVNNFDVRNCSKLAIRTAHLWLMIIKNLRMYPALRAPMPRIQPNLDLSDVSGLLTEHTEHTKNRKQNTEHTEYTENITRNTKHTYLANSMIKITKTWWSGPSKALCNTQFFIQSNQWLQLQYLKREPTLTVI